MFSFESNKNAHHLSTIEYNNEKFLEPIYRFNQYQHPARIIQTILRIKLINTDRDNWLIRRTKMDIQSPKLYQELEQNCQLLKTGKRRVGSIRRSVYLEMDGLCTHYSTRWKRFDSRANKAKRQNRFSKVQTSRFKKDQNIHVP